VGGSVFVLFVDDDAAFADAAARSFESVGMRTVVALGSMCSATIMMAAYRQLNWPNRAVVE
jgi:ActR/RegA family two-component response regulator